MAYNDRMQIKNGLTVRYNYETRPIQIRTTVYPLYMVTRLITKQYTIVGYSNYETAKASANALIEQGGQYWRSVAGWQIIDNGEGQAPSISLSWAGMPVADCTPVHTAGCMW